MALNKEEVRRKIIDIGHALIAQGGSEALQARVIAKQVGISVGSIYNLVGDIDALHRLINSELLDELGMVGSSTIEDLDKRGVKDLRLRLLALAHAYFRFVEQHQNQWTALLAFNRNTKSVDICIRTVLFIVQASAIFWTASTLMALALLTSFSALSTAVYAAQLMQ